MQLPELSDRNKMKVFMIIDIQKAQKLLGIPPITPVAFDYLYDLDIDELGRIMSDLQRLVMYRKSNCIYHTDEGPD